MVDVTYAACSVYRNQTNLLVCRKEQKPTNRKVRVAGRTEKVERPETDGEDRQIGSERRRLKDRNRTKKIDRLETRGEG